MIALLALLGFASAPAFPQDFRTPLVRAPYSLSFGEITVGKTSEEQTITLLNTGNSGGQIDRITVAGDFIQSTNCPAPPKSLAQNQTCGVEVKFKPQAVGPVSGTVSIFHDQDLVPLTVSLTGSGTLSVSELALSPTALKFGDQNLATMSKPQTITLSNPGKKPLEISSIEMDGDFTMMSGSTCERGQSSLAPGATCNAVIAFGPLKIGIRLGSLKITDDAEGSPQIVSLSGMGKQ